LNAPLHLRARNQLCLEIVLRNIAQSGLVKELYFILKEKLNVDILPDFLCFREDFALAKVNS